MLTIFFIFNFYFYASYTLTKNSDFWYNEPMPFEHCQHVYRDLGKNPCPFCGGETHEIDWTRNRRELAEHREKYGWFYNTGQWWSI